MLLESLKFIKTFGGLNRRDRSIEDIGVDMESVIFRTIQKDFGHGVIIRKNLGQGR